MLSLEFNSSPESTLGVEVELGIVDKQTLELVPASSEILDEISARFGGEHPKAKHEFYQSSIEIITGICDTVADAQADLNETIAEVTVALDKRGLALQGGGLHPSTSWRDLTVTDLPRYQNFASEIGWPAQRSMCHGIHYHVGVRSGDAAVAIANSAAIQMPLFIALSGSSPFWHSYDTGLVSTRTKVFEQMPTEDLPPHLSGWDEFVDLLDVLIEGGALKSVRELWWDIRPHPGFGTVEMRMTDAMGTMREIISLAAVAQSLIHDLGQRFAEGQALPTLPPWVLKENKWRAARHGLAAELIVNSAGDTLPIVELVEEQLESLAPAAAELGCKTELESVSDIVAGGPGYLRQRAAYATNEDFRDVVQLLLDEWRTNEPIGW